MYLISITNFENKLYLCSICRGGSERQLRMVTGTAAERPVPCASGNQTRQYAQKIPLKKA